MSVFRVHQLSSLFVHFPTSFAHLTHLPFSSISTALSSSTFDHPTLCQQNIAAAEPSLLSFAATLGSKPVTVARPSTPALGPMPWRTFAILLSLAVCATDALDLPDLPGFLENLGDAIVESAKDVYSGKFTWNYTWHDSTVQAPSQFLPLVDQIREMPEATRDERNHWFGSCFLVCFVVVAFCGTIIVTLGPMVKGHAPQSYIRVGSIQRGEAASEPEVISEPSQSLSKLCQTVLVVLSFGGTFLASLTACVWSLQTGRLSKTVGLDWEVYLLLFALVSFWLLVQAVFAVRMLKPGEKFKLSTFVVACLTSLTPFVSDYFDTLKDAIFGALCVQSQHLGIQILGWLCWVYLLAIHIFFVRRPTCFAELSSTYLSVLLASPASQEESGGGGCLQELLLLLYKQLTSTKREMLLIENVPQAVFSIAFLYFEGGSTFVTIVSLGVPIVQIVLTLLLTNPVRRCVATALGKKINEALIRGNYVMSWQIWCEAGCCCVKRTSVESQKSVMSFAIRGF